MPSPHEVTVSAKFPADTDFQAEHKITAKRTDKALIFQQ